MDYFRTWAEIDLDNLIFNFRNIKKRAGEGVKLSAVIKADAYGHGALPIAHALQNETDYFSVAIAEEALSLRKGGIEKPIHLLGYTPPALFNLVTEHSLTVTTYNFAHAKLLSEHGVQDKKTVSVFLAIDTGMSRLGFSDNDQAIEDILQISKLPNLSLDGIFSHIARADEFDKSSAKEQDRRFSTIIEKLEQAGLFIPLKSLYNSAAIIDLEAKYNLVRPGISLYGLYPSDEVAEENIALRPIMSLKTHVVNIQTIEKGSGVSYGHDFVAEKPLRVAALSAGYADGVHRLLSNRGRVLINGEYAPILGRICMDFFMVDISHIPHVKIDDIAILIGSDKGKHISADEVAAHAETISYEITCSISKRVPRVFMKDGKVIFTNINI